MQFQLEGLPVCQLTPSEPPVVLRHEVIIPPPAHRPSHLCPPGSEVSGPLPSSRSPGRCHPHLGLGEEARKKKTRIPALMCVMRSGEGAKGGREKATRKRVREVGSPRPGPAGRAGRGSLGKLPLLSTAAMQRRTKLGTVSPSRWHSDSSWQPNTWSAGEIQGEGAVSPTEALSTGLPSKARLALLAACSRPLQGGTPTSQSQQKWEKQWSPKSNSTPRLTEVFPSMKWAEARIRNAKTLPEA